MFCEKLQNLCSETVNPDQMDKNGCDFPTQRSPNPQIRCNFKSLKILHTSVIILTSYSKL